MEMKQIKATSRGEKSRKTEYLRCFSGQNKLRTDRKYDDKLVRQLIRNITVVNASKIEVVFKSEIIIKELLDK